MKIWITHPSGNPFVRALLEGAPRRGHDVRFLSSIAFSGESRWVRNCPAGLRELASRRAYDLPASRIRAFPLRELAERIRAGLVHSRSFRSVDRIYQSLDRNASLELAAAGDPPDAVYSYEDGALETFQVAELRGVRRVYDLPIAYWTLTREILSQEAERLPDWEPTLIATRDSREKLDRKSAEIELADAVVCPSPFVYRSLPETIRSAKTCIVAPFGSPVVGLENARGSKPLRVLFAGAMSQRKGLADVFEAMKLLHSSHLELVVMGQALMPPAFYRARCGSFTHEPPRSHRAVLDLMRTCDVLVLPSLVEGRALVQQEALACGLPLVVTANAGGEDLIEEGTGFLVPIRSPETIAEKIEWFAVNRAALESMREVCRAKARSYTWGAYSDRILSGLERLRPKPRLAVA